VTAAALRNSHRFVELLNAVPFPAFLQDLLQNTQFAVDQIRTGRFSTSLLVPPEVTDIDVLKAEISAFDYLASSGRG
jgi:hypothetical protein